MPEFLSESGKKSETSPDMSRTARFRLSDRIGSPIFLLATAHLAALMVVVILRVVFSYSQCLDVSQFLINVSLARGIDPYSMQGRLTPPFYAAAYGPIFYLGNYAFAQLAGNTLEIVKFWQGINFALLILGLYRLFKDLLDTTPKENALFISLFLGLYSTTYHICRIRPDIQALMTFVFAVHFAIRSVRKPHFARPVISMSLATALCLFTKQSYVLTAYVPFLYLLMHRRFDILRLAVPLTLASIAVVWGFCSFMFGHANWFRTLLMPDIHFPMSVSSMLINLKTTFLWTGTLPVILTSAYLVLAFLRSGGARLPDPSSKITRNFILCWLVCSFSAACYFSRLSASNAHYFAEFGVAFILLVGFLYKHSKVSNDKVLKALLAISLIGALVGDARLFRGEYFALRSAAYQDELVGILASFTPVDEPVISFSSDIPLRAGRTIHFMDDGAYVHYITYGANIPELYGKFEEYLGNRSFSAILIAPYFGYFSEAFLARYDYFPVKTKESYVARSLAPALYLRKDLYERYAHSLSKP